MRAHNFLIRLNTLNYDSISKLNLYKKQKAKNFFRVKNLKLLALLDSSDKLFFKKIMVLNSIAINWFNQKLYVYKILNQKNMRKNNIFYQLGCTITNPNYINQIINYINNVMASVALRIDNNFKLDYFNHYMVYRFENLNYLLGFNNSSYFNIKINYNIIVIYSTTINRFKIKEFYEKIFFL
uniref:Uncharacterized protein n=1 Tax=Paramoeba aparasomata TaxID=2583407 RepID=A0A5P8HBJ9_9EUKA|nr:hypothetical protein [Paramoeba aparasomata]